MKLSSLTPERLNRAVRIYCNYAYGRDVPDRIPRFDPGISSSQILELMLDESNPDSDQPHRRYAMRLGSRDYPYMKLVIEECFYHDEFFFLVDTHDEIDLAPESPDYSAWVGLRNLNRKVKDAVEHAWWEADLATLRSLRERLLTEGGTERAGSREEVILLVQDDAAVHETLTLAMARHGFASLTARTPEEAVRRAAIARPDCVVIDAFVSGRPGRELCQLLREKMDVPGTPIVLMTSRSDFLKSAGGADAHVLTPADEGVLFRTIDHLLKNRGEKVE